MGEKLKDNVTRPMKEENGNGEPRVLYGQAKDFTDSILRQEMAKMF